MDWFQYSCCGATFSRLVRPPDLESACPRCRRLVKPLVRLRVKGNPEPFALSD